MAVLQLLARRSLLPLTQLDVVRTLGTTTPRTAGFYTQEHFELQNFLKKFQEERLTGAAGLLTPLQYCIQSTIDYTRQRSAFGKPILDNQYVHYRLAELETEVECLKALTYRAAELYANGEDVTKLVSMCKLKGGRLAREITDSCLQFWGGMGFTKEVPVGRMFTDFRLVSIGGGADEVMLAIICKYMGILPKLGKK